MSASIVIFGAGKRVITDVLPALSALSEEVSVHGVFRRSGSPLLFVGKELETKPVSALSTRDLAGTTHAYAGVPAGEVQGVVDVLIEKRAKHLHLIIDTPVRPLRGLDFFHKVSVAEDSAYLPWLGALDRALRERGGVRRLSFLHSGFQYHAVALAKALATHTEETFPSASLSRLSFGSTKKLMLSTGAKVKIVAPRDYATGVFEAAGIDGTVFSSHGVDLNSGIGVRRQESGQWICQVADQIDIIPPEYARVLDNAPGELNVVKDMLLLKRVGLAKLFHKAFLGAIPYSINDALNDVEASTRRR